MSERTVQGLADHIAERVREQIIWWGDGLIAAVGDDAARRSPSREEGAPMNPATDRTIVLRYVESLPDGGIFDLSDDDPPVLTVTDRTPHARIGAAIMHLAEGNDQL